MSVNIRTKDLRKVYTSPRATLVPPFPHFSLLVVLPALLALDGVLLAAGLLRFQKKALT